MSHLTRPCLLLVSAISATLASCASNRWTDAQRASLSSVSIAPSVSSSAYGKPLGSDNVQAPVVATGGSFGTGAAAGAGAQLIVEIGAAVQQKMFESRYADAIAKAPSTAPADLPNRIRLSVAKSLASQPFFKGKIRDASPNRFHVIVDSYRYVRTGKENGEILVTPSFYGRFELTNAAGEKLLNEKFAAAASNYRRPLPEFVRDKSLATRAFEQAIDLIALQACNAVNARLGDPAQATELQVPSASPGAQPTQLQPVSFVGSSPDKPYKLTQSTSLITGATRSIQVGGHKLKIAGSADGKVVLIRPDSLVGSNLKTGGSEYEAIRQKLNRAHIRILRQRDMLSGILSVGFYLELDGDGYSVLTQGS